MPVDISPALTAPRSNAPPTTQARIERSGPFAIPPVPNILRSDQLARPNILWAASHQIVFGMVILWSPYGRSMASVMAEPWRNRGGTPTRPKVSPSTQTAT